MASVTLASVRTRIRQRTDQEYSDSEFVTDAELAQLINTSFNELYGLLVRHSLQRAESVQTVTATGAGSYALNSDFFALLGVFRVEGNSKIRLPRHDHRVRPSTGTVGPATTHRLVGMTCVFNPTPTSGTYEIVYVPVPATVEDDDDILDGVLGWEEYIVVDVAIRVLMKEESDVSDLQRERDRLYTRIVDEANHAEMTDGIVIANVRNLQTAFDEGDYIGARGYRGPKWW